MATLVKEDIMLETKNKAFRRGFVSGLRSPYTVFPFRKTHYAFKPVNFVALSWQRVGKSLEIAIEQEGRIDEQRAQASVKAH